MAQNHNSDESPEMDFESMPEMVAPPEQQQDGSSRTPGTSDIFMQRNQAGNMLSPLDRLLRGSTNPQEFLALTNVAEEDIQTITRILYFDNLFNCGDGRLQECIWAQLTLRRAEGGKFMKQVVEILTGMKEQTTEEGRSRNRAFLDRYRAGQNPPLSGQNLRAQG